MVGALRVGMVAAVVEPAVVEDLEEDSAALQDNLLAACWMVESRTNRSNSNPVNNRQVVGNRVVLWAF